MKLFKNWREKAIEEAERQATKSIQDSKKALRSVIKKTLLVKQVKFRIIECLRENTDIIMIRSKNHKLAHDVAKELNITLKKTPEYDGFNYKGEYKGIRITVYGIEEAVKCKVESHKEMREVTVYESVCK